MLYAFLLVVFLFSLYMAKKKITKSWFENFLLDFMEKRVSQYKVKNLENHIVDETDMIEFLENQKNKLLKRDVGFLNKSIFLFFKKISGYSRKDCEKLVKEFHEKEINKVIYQDLRFKDFEKISSNIHFQLTDWEYILEKPKILYQATRKNLITKDMLENLIEDVHYSKTEFNDEFTTKTLNRIQYNVINLLIDLKNIKQEN